MQMRAFLEMARHGLGCVVDFLVAFFTAALLLCASASCREDYELSLGSMQQQPIHDAGADSDAASSSDAGVPMPVSCSSDDECAGLVLSICDPDMQRCVQCMSNSDCQEAVGKPHCDLETRACAPCVEDSECEDDRSCMLGECR
jgi:hypothetical protein